ncbi:MAG: hypothetical protein ACREHG_09545 [Candidatus Saccharimonadales bacterium]
MREVFAAYWPSVCKHRWLGSIVMEKGAIVEEGTHSELLDRDGVYADLWSHQSGNYIQE